MSKKFYSPGKIFVGEKYSSGQKFRRGKFSPGKIFVGENFRHLTKISSLFPDEVFPEKVCHNHHTRTVIIHLSLLIPKLYLCLSYLCITDSSEGTPVALHNRFDELSTISEIPDIPNSPPPPPSNASPPHTPSQTSTSSYTYTYVSEPRSPTSLPHSPEHITVPTCSRSLIRYTTSYTNRCHHESEQLDERWLCLF